MISLEDVAKEYAKSRVALSHVDFQVKRGEFVFLIGPSGSGKTTVLKLLYMEERPTHGDVTVNGVHSGTAKRSEIALDTNISKAGFEPAVRKMLQECKRPEGDKPEGDKKDKDEIAL